MEAKNITFKYYIQDYSGNIYTEYFDLSDIEHCKPDSVMSSYFEDGLEPVLLAKEIQTGHKDDKNIDIYTGDTIGYYNGVDLVKTGIVTYPFFRKNNGYELFVIGNKIEGNKLF